MSESLDEQLAHHARGMRTVGQAHGRERPAARDFLARTVEDLFAEVWSRDVLSDRDRRLLLLGLLVGQGLDDQVAVQLDVSMRTGVLTPEELREIVVFLTHYAGWARGARLNDQVEDLIERFMDG
ncbi:carboxymuconolactone decarboxylase family protein [Thermopolyspora flexuosa]|jgi:4-carboxymuconolactone decarboxylase|uniref:4-carboxymuconolactone decarboxylase n=1 Tax=Thermopolyspora flexuosa TaxID=103836 RepID=A0A543IW33_9ACTN|nr:carboxymuconolactone decarboxylase family protein [Thermopolyspora flexuosa]TQM74786.1 4-carboxymuconolactone decarboxylase [Thermopolyspora flexuosa]